jgi:hypothetical protein
VMHVSRGISAEQPIRINCSPELTKLVLRCPAGASVEPPGDEEASRTLTGHRREA